MKSGWYNIYFPFAYKKYLNVRQLRLIYIFSKSFYLNKYINMKNLLLLMWLTLIFCWVSYAENDNPEINDADVQAVSTEETEATNEETAQSTNTEDTTANNEVVLATTGDNTRTSSEENDQTVDNEASPSVSDENIQESNDAESQPTSNNNEQVTKGEISQTVVQEDTPNEEDEQVVEDEGKVGLISKIKEDIHEKIYSQEFKDAYEFASKNKITTMDSIDLANMEWWLNRISMAKMLSNYATNVLGKEPADVIVPEFSDVSEKLNEEYGNAVDLAYQLWIMWIWVDKFRPYDPVTRAEFATALSRMLYGLADWLDKYYTTHMEKLKEEWIISNTDPSLKELRWYVMIMLMRSAKTKIGTLKEKLENKLIEDYQNLVEDTQSLDSDL